MVDGSVFDASRRNLLRYAKLITLFMRHGANTLVCAVVLIAPPAGNATAGRIVACALGAWSLYRLANRSTGSALLAVDYAATIAACLATPVLVAGPHFYLANSAPVAIAGTAVVSFTLATAVSVSPALVVGIAAAFATGASVVVGWSHVGDIFNLYYFALQWATAALIRLMVVRVADSVDAARSDRLAVELQQEVNTAVREYDREQMRLLHDTVASTLLMVGTGTDLAVERVAAQAKRDLHLFSGDRMTSVARADLVAAVREHAGHTSTPVRFIGASQVWLDGNTAVTIAAAAREALTNVDRHAEATTVTVTIDSGLVRIEDDGCGFDPSQPSRGHGISSSITARMHGLGGTAVLTTRPGHGTSVELCWRPDEPREGASHTDPERLIERTRTGYGLALVTYAVVNLLTMVPAALPSTGHPLLQWALASVAAAATLSAIPGILGRTWFSPYAGTVTLLIVALVQPGTLPVDLLGTEAQWTQNSIGWTLLPLLLRERVRYAAGVLIAYWTVPGIYTLVRDQSAHTVANLGYGTASILIVQLSALLFSNFIRRAASAASTETITRMRVLAANHIADAVQAGYRRRYADLVDTIRPLLVALAETGLVDAAARRRAQLEYQRLRALFDQSSTFDHPILRQLRPLIDSAQDRGLAVSMYVDGRLPILDEAAALQLAQLAGKALAVASGSARITVTTEPAAVELSVMCRGARGIEILMEPIENDQDVIELTAFDDKVWLTVRHSLAGGTYDHAHAGHAT